MHSRNYMIKESSKENSLEESKEIKVTSKRFKATNILRFSIVGAEKILDPMRNKHQNSVKVSPKYSLRKFMKKTKKNFFSKQIFKSKNDGGPINIQETNVTNDGKRGKYHSVATDYTPKYNSTDFGCQYSLTSNYSMEIISHMLTRSMSQMSSADSIFDVDWQRRHQAKQPNNIHVFVYNLIRRFKQSKTKLTNKMKKNHVLVLHVPERFSHTSIDTISSVYSKVVKETSLNTDDMPQHSKNVRPITRPVNKICRPGEILVRKDVAEKQTYKISLLSSYHRLNTP